MVSWVPVYAFSHLCLPYGGHQGFQRRELHSDHTYIFLLFPDCDVNFYHRIPRVFVQVPLYLGDDSVSISLL